MKNSLLLLAGKRSSKPWKGFSVLCFGGTLVILGILGIIELLMDCTSLNTGWDTSTGRVVKPQPLGPDDPPLDFLQIGLKNVDDSVCQVDNVKVDHFPPSFDQSIYETRNKGKVSQGVTLDYSHYIAEGRAMGLFCSDGIHLRSILPHIVAHFEGNSLEIGPGIMPVLKGEKVKYFDILNLEGLKEKMGQYLPLDPEMREIDYVVPNGDLSKISGNAKFSLVFSSHVVEHQLDLVVHFQQVSSLLDDGGYYALMVSLYRWIRVIGLNRDTRISLSTSYSTILSINRYLISGTVMTIG